MWGVPTIEGWRAWTLNERMAKTLAAIRATLLPAELVRIVVEYFELPSWRGNARIAGAEGMFERCAAIERPEQRVRAILGALDGGYHDMARRLLSDHLTSKVIRGLMCVSRMGMFLLLDIVREEPGLISAHAGYTIVETCTLRTYPTIDK